MASRDYYNDNDNQGSYGRGEGRRNEGYGGDSYNNDNRRNENYGGDERRNDNYGRNEGRNDNYGRNEGRNDNYGRNDPRHGDMNDTRYEGNQPSYGGGDDFSSAAQHASQHHSTEDSSLFSTALGFLNEHKSQFTDPSRYEVDEQHAVAAHNSMYNNSGNEEGQRHDSSTVGAGAAMQALKMFTSGGASDGGMDKNKLIGMAMAQAGKLWDQKQGAGASMVSQCSIKRRFIGMRCEVC